MKLESFTHAGKSYQIRIISDGLSVFVKVFSDGKPVNSYRYEATLELVHDAATVSDLDVVKHLIEIAKSDVTNK